MTFAEKLKAWRGKRTQAAAAAALGVPPRTYEEWEQGRHKPRGFAFEAVSVIIQPYGTASGKSPHVQRLIDSCEKKLPVGDSQKSKPKTKRTRPARRTGRKE